MRALALLTVANLRSYVRDRAALFWTLAFPLIFIVLFGFIFQGSRFEIQLGFVDLDHSEASAQLRQAFTGTSVITLTEGDEATVLQAMRDGDVGSVVVVPAGYGASVAAGTPVQLTYYVDASQSQQTSPAAQVVGNILGAVNLAGRPPLVSLSTQTIQTSDLNAISYFVPSILGLSIMQVGLFAAIPLVADREKLILKRLGATPLRRWQLVGSNVAMRLLIAVAQAVIIVLVGSVLFGVKVTGSLFVIGAFIVLGSLAFLALGYVIASFAKTEDAANGMTSIVQFPMMFLSGTFFAIDAMPGPLQAVARFVPLTYLSDALRQVMVDGAAFSPLWLCAAILAGWLVVCFGIAAKRFAWQ
jgi:ABC-2 type transport system permease protein